MDKPMVMRYTKHLQECCDDLTRRSEYPSDKSIRRHISLWNFVARVQDCYETSYTTIDGPRGGPVVLLTVESLLRELEYIKAQQESDDGQYCDTVGELALALPTTVVLSSNMPSRDHKRT